ncbi:hypothetical protein ACFSOZ_07215 [Mesorhizobium newzealandense]|uniref:Transcriptional regulator n=1 Tax=Mesorhizobium newzealandense TaxID=1300302 RepID=A0ABW4U7G5_9HYPH
MANDKALKRLIKRQMHLTQPGANDHLKTTAPRRLVSVTCAVCGKDFEAVQTGRRQPSTRCSEVCRREARRRYSNAYNATAKAELEDLRARAAAGDLERFGIGRDGRPTELSTPDVDGKPGDA